jgi:Uma2 family endonuclease
MKAVMANVPEHILAWRRKTGADQWDEMWEGVLHMAPSPNRDHQELELHLAIWLQHHWAQPKGCRVLTRINVAAPGAWPEDYRIPDIVLLTPDRFHIDCNEYFDGGPEVVVEIHSEGDESYDKFDFYAKVGVREVWVIDRDTKQPEIFERTNLEFELRPADSERWLYSNVTNIEMRATTDELLEIRIAGCDETVAKLP